MKRESKKKQEKETTWFEWNRFSLGLAILCLALFANMSFALYRSWSVKKTLEPKQKCEEQKWRWLELATELEEDLHRWAYYGDACLSNKSFVPVGMGVENQTFIWNEFEYGYPVATDTRFPYIALPDEHHFLAGRSIMICLPERRIEGRILRIEKGSSGLTLAKIELPQEEVISDFLVGTFVVQFASRRLELLNRKNADQKILIQRSANQGVRPLATGLTKFEIISLKNEGGKQISLKLQFLNDQCSFQRDIVVPIESEEKQQGLWFVRNNELEFLPYLQEKSN